MTNINIDQFNNIENINIGGTALLCSSNPHCALDLQYNNEECVVERQGTILSIKLKNSNSTISALAKKWKLDMILVRGPPKIYNTFQNSILQNSLQFDLIHSLEGKKSNSETYVIVSFVAQVNDIYSKNPSYSEINKIQIPSKANNYTPININLSPNSFFPTNENSFYQYNIPKTTRFNQIYMKNVRYLSSTFFNLFNNNILGGNYATLYNNYLETSRLPVSPNPIFYNQNMPMYPLGTIMDCKTGCRKPDGNILESKPVENKEDSSIVPKIIEKLDAEDEKLPAKCFSKTTSTDSTTAPKEESPEKCGKEITIGGKKIGYTQMITTCIFASIIAVFVSYIIYKIGNQAVNSNSKKVGVSFIVSWLGVFIIFLSYYIVLNGKNWKGYEEEKDAIEKKKNAYAGFTWATLLINMIILFGIAIFLFLKNKFNFSNNVIKIFKYAPLLILIVIFISAIVLGAKSYGKKCKVEEKKDEQTDENKKDKEKIDIFSVVICFGIIMAIVPGFLILFIKKFPVFSKIWWGIMGFLILFIAGLITTISIFTGKLNGTIKNIQNENFPDDKDCRTETQKTDINKFKNTLQTYLGILIAIIPTIAGLLVMLGSVSVKPKLKNMIVIYFSLIIVYSILFIAFIKNKKYNGKETMIQLCKKVNVNLNPLLITMGVFIILWVAIIIYYMFFKKIQSNALNAINSSNLSYGDKDTLRTAIGDSLFTTQANRSKAVDILKTNPALARSLANQGYSLDKIQNPKLADAFSTSRVPVKTLNSGVKSSGVLDLNKFNKKLNKSSLSGNDKKFVKNYLSSGNSDSQINKDKFAQLIAKDPSLKSYINKKGINLADIKSKTIPKLQTEIVSY